MNKYIFNKFNFSSKYKMELINFVKNLSNAEIGGNRLYDGSNNHYMQNPIEIVRFIFELKKYEKKIKKKLTSFLEIGFANGINNSLLNKLFNFKKIVAVDIIDAGGINTNNFYANLRFKNLALVCGDSTNKATINTVEKLGKYDLIFIDGGHDYEIVKKDFENYKKFLSPHGIIALHDIRSNLALGVPKFWRELKLKQKKYFSFLEIFEPNNFMQCGIGIILRK